MMMATDIKKFKGSNEERLLQKFLKSGFHKTDFLNIVIKSCNVQTPVSFTNAFVVLELLTQCDEIGEQEPDSGVTAEKINFEEAFNMKLIEKLINSGVGDLEDEVIPAVLTIMNYLQDMEYHESALYKVKKEGGDEAKISAVMAQHLFSQLIPGNKYFLDNRSKHLPKVCPCSLPKCGKEIKAGCTALGSGDTWHGYVDILLNNNVAVAVINDDDDEEDADADNPGPSPPKQLCSDADNPGPSPPKQLCSDADNPGPSPPKQLCRRNSSVSLCIEVKTGKQNKNNLLNMNVINQIIAETITNAFSQINLTEALTGWHIPTFGCTVDQVVVFMYDPKNDVLLQSMELMPLWKKESLHLPTVFFIWMLLNFPIFLCKNLADHYEFDRSNFHKLAETKLKKYQKLVIGKYKSFTSEDDTYAEVILPKMHYLAKHVKHKD